MQRLSIGDWAAVERQARQRVNIARKLYTVVVVDCCGDSRWYLCWRGTGLSIAVNSEQGQAQTHLQNATRGGSHKHHLGSDIPSIKGNFLAISGQETKREVTRVRQKSDRMLPHVSINSFVSNNYKVGKGE